MADDCLSLLLGSMEARRLASRPVTYFLTAGWLRYENNIITTYQQSVEKFGKRQADRINRLMFKHYRRIGLVKTGCYDLAVIADRVGPLAETLELTVESLEGDDDWLKELLLGPCLDSDRFLVVGPNSTICFDAWSKLLMGSDPVSSSSQLCQEALPASP
jgi:hypothetical protein